VATMIGCLQTQAFAFLAVFVYVTHATHATQAIAFEWKPDLMQWRSEFIQTKRKIKQLYRVSSGRSAAAVHREVDGRRCTQFAVIAVPATRLPFFRVLVAAFTHCRLHAAERLTRTTTGTSIDSTSLCDFQTK